MSFKEYIAKRKSAKGSQPLTTTNNELLITLETLRNVKLKLVNQQYTIRAPAAVTGVRG